MAYYKGREVSVESHIPVEYKVQIRHQDGVLETVNLLELTMSKREIVTFVKGEMDRMKGEQELVENRRKKDPEETKKADGEVKVVKPGETAPPAARTLANPFARQPVVEKK